MFAGIALRCVVAWAGPTASFPSIGPKRGQYLLRGPSLTALLLSGAAVFAPSAAWAACTPATGSNVIVTCVGATLNQGPGANTGYGNGLQNGLSINIGTSASVAGTSTGIDVGSNTTITNLGTVTTAGNGVIGDVFGINANGINLTVTNSGTIGKIDIPNNAIDAAGINVQDTGLSVTNNFGATIQGSIAIQGVGTGAVMNSGLINGITGGGGGEGIDFAANNTSFVTVTNNATGVITGDANGINANSAVVFNFGTISGPGFGGAGLNANTLVLTNYASGLITGDSFGVSGSQTPNLTITNFGRISATGLGGTAIEGNVVNLVNSGTISVAPGISQSAISMSRGSIVNNAGGVITGDFTGIAAFGNTSIFNAGTITATGAAISFFSGGNTLTLGPGSVIIGTAHGFGADTFQLGGTGTDSFNAALFAAQFSGYSTFNKIGASTWTLTGTNATAMPWTISAGTLNVSGALANSTMTVNGGILGGTGTVGATTINNGGTLMPGNGTPGTFLTVNGNLAFQSGALYLVQLNTSTSTFTHVTGTAALAGTVPVTSPVNSLRFNSPYTILTSTGLNGTRFNALLTPTGITGSLIYTGNNVLLNLTSGLGQIPGENANQRAGGTALDNAFNAAGGVNGPLGAIFSGNVPQNLTQAAGEVATGSQQTTFDAMNLFLGLVTDPFTAGRGDSAGGGAGTTPFAEEDDGASAYGARGTPRGRSERDAYAAVYRKAPALTEGFTQRWSVWAAGFGGSQTTDGNAALGSNTVTSRIAATAVGADYRFSPSTIAGFALAGGGTSFSLANALGTGRSDLFQAGAYLRHTAGPAYVAAALAYGWQDVTTDRTVTIAGVDQLRASFNANAFSGRAEGGYRFATPWLGVTPYAAVQVTTFDLPAYAEQAITGTNAFALAYGAKDVTATRSELGLRTDKSFAMPDAILTLRGRFAWAHDFNTDRNIAATFQALPAASFVVGGAAPAHEAALTTASAEMKWLNGWSAAATFEGEFSQVTRSYAGKGVVRYQW